MTANLDFVVGRYHERPFAVCEQTRMMASTLSDSVSSIVGSLSGNLGRKRRCLRAEAATVASAYMRSEEHTSELQSLMRISYAVFCLKKKKNKINRNINAESRNI